MFKEICRLPKTGKIFALPSGAVMVCQNTKSPFCFIIGVLDKQDVEEVNKILSISEYPNPRIFTEVLNHYLFLNSGWKLDWRIRFKYPEEYLVRRRNDIQEIPPGFKIKEIDADIFRNCLYYDYKRVAYQDMVPVGYVLLNEEKRIVCEIYLFVGGGEAEIDIITNPEFREKGYGLLLAQFAIFQSIANGLQPVWSCNIKNVASFKLAQKLGFIPHDHYDAFLVRDE